MNTELFYIPGPWSGKLAIAPRPRGGDWLEDEILNWKRAGIATVVSALEANETAELDLSDEEKWCRANGMEFLLQPIPDRGVPPALKPVGELVRLLNQRLSGGGDVAIHCRQGIGRSSLLAAVLEHAGLDHETTFARIETARGRPVPDTPAQKDWVKVFVKQLGSA